LKKKKQLFVILAVALILSGAYGLVNLSKNKNLKSEESIESSYEVPESWKLTELDEADLNSVTLDNEAGRFTLVRKADDWLVQNRENLKLDPQAKAEFIMSFLRVISFDQISPNSSNAVAYGLDENSNKAILGLTDGSEIILSIGSTNPSGSGHYVQNEGDPAIYLLSSYISQALLANVNMLRDRSLPSINPQELAYMKISGNREIEIVPHFQFETFESGLSHFLMTSPYKRPVPVNSETFSKEMENLFKGLFIQSFPGDDTDSSVTGLNESAKILTMKDTSGAELNLLVGKDDGQGGLYCKLPEDPGIFTISKDSLKLVNMRPFDLADHFIRLIGIDLIDRLTVRRGSKTWEGSIKRLDKETEEYYFQGKKIEEDPFKEMYQKVLYLLSEGETPEGTQVSANAEITIEYTGNSANPGKTKAEFYNYNDDYYAVRIDSNPSEFLIGRYQLDVIFSDITIDTGFCIFLTNSLNIQNIYQEH